MFLETINITSPAASREFEGINLCHLTYYHYISLSATSGRVQLDFLNTYSRSIDMTYANWLLLKAQIDTACGCTGGGGGDD